MRKINLTNLWFSAACTVLVLAACYIIVFAIDLLPDPAVSETVEAIEVVEATPKPVPEAVPTVPVPSKMPVIFEDPAPEPEPEPEWICPLTDREVKYLANLVYAEARNQSEYGQRLVVDTVLNRVDSDEFPDTVETVLYQRNQYYPKGHAVYFREPLAEYVEVVLGELKERTDYDVVFFRTGHYHPYGTPLFQVGEHYFSTS